ILSNLVAVAAALTVMIGFDWRLTILALAALPLFVLPARRVARLLRRVTEDQMERNAVMSGILQEAFNVSGALLVRLFGRRDAGLERFERGAAAVRGRGARGAMVGRWFCAAPGVGSAVASAGIFWLGGWLVVRGELDIGVVVLFSTLRG